jgi:RND superfamily putative drug exporter
VAAWIVATVGIFAVSTSVGKKAASDFTLPGTGSQHAVDLLKSRFPAQAGDADQIVFHAKTGTLSSAVDRATITPTLARVARLPHVTSVLSPYAPGAHASPWALPGWLKRRLPRVALEAQPSAKPQPTLEPAFETGS